jgi:hypothetical protein
MDAQTTIGRELPAALSHYFQSLVEACAGLDGFLSGAAGWLREQSATEG